MIIIFKFISSMQKNLFIETIIRLVMMLAVLVMGLTLVSCEDSSFYGVEEKDIQPEVPSENKDTVVSVVIAPDFSLICVDSTDLESGKSFKYEGKTLWDLELSDESHKFTENPTEWNFNTTLSWTPERFIIRENEKINFEGITVKPVKNGIDATINFDMNLSFDVKARTEEVKPVMVEGFEKDLPTVKCEDIKVLVDEITYTALAQEVVSNKLMDCWRVEIPCLAIYDNGDVHSFTLLVKIGKGAYVEPEQPDVPDVPEDPDTDEPENPGTDEPENPDPVDPEPEEPEVPEIKVDVNIPSSFGQILGAQKTIVIRNGDVSNRTECMAIICTNGVYALIDGSYYAWLGASTSGVVSAASNGSWHPATIISVNPNDYNSGWVYAGSGASNNFSVSACNIQKVYSPILSVSFVDNGNGTYTIDGLVYTTK